MTHLDQPSPTIRFRTWIAVSVVIVGLALTLSAHRLALPVIAATSSEQVNGTSAPVLASVPAGYRDWTLISVATVGTPVNDIRAKLGNEVAISAFRLNHQRSSPGPG